MLREQEADGNNGVDSDYSVYLRGEESGEGFMGSEVLKCVDEGISLTI